MLQQALNLHCPVIGQLLPAHWKRSHVILDVWQAEATEPQILEEGLRETGNEMPKVEVNVSRTRTL